MFRQRRMEDPFDEILDKEIISGPATPELEGFTNSIKVLCIVSEPFDGRLFFNRYQDQRWQLFELLPKVNRSNVYLSDIPISTRRLRGRIAGQIKDAKIIEEPLFGGNDREWEVSESTKLITIILRNRLVQPWYANQQWELCSNAEISKTALLAILGTAEEISSKPVVNFDEILFRSINLHDRDRAMLQSYRGNAPDVAELLHSVIGGVNDRHPEVLFRFLLVLDRIRALFISMQLNLLQAFNLALEFAPLELLEYLGRQSPRRVVEVLCCFIDIMLARLSGDEDKVEVLVAWALLRLVSSPSPCKTAEGLVSSRPELVHICLTHFKPHLTHHQVKLVMCRCTSLRSLHRLCFVMCNETEDFVDLATVRSVLGTSQCVKCILSKQDHVDELRAMFFFGQKLDDLRLYEELYQQQSFRIRAVGHLPIVDLAREALFPLLAWNLPFRYKLMRAEEFKSFVRERESGDPPATAIYPVLKGLLSLQPGSDWDALIEEIYSILPTAVGPGLCRRLAAFACETDFQLVQMEAAKLKKDFILPGNDLDQIREYLWKKRQEFLVNSPNRMHIVDLLAFLWQEQRIRHQDEKHLSPLESSAIRSIIAEVGNEEEAEYLIAVLTVHRVRILHEKLKVEVKEVPSLRHNASYGALLKMTSSCTRGLELIAENLNRNKVVEKALNVFLNHPAMGEVLSIMVPTFSFRTINEIHNKVTQLRSQWNCLLVSFRDLMPVNPRHRECSLELTQQVIAQIDSLETLNIDDWKSADAFGGQDMIALFEDLISSQNSLVFRFISKRKNDNLDENQRPASVSTALGDWKRAIESSIADWREAVLRINTHVFSSSSLLAALSSILDEEPRCPELSNDPEKARNLSRRYISQVCTYRENRIQSEVEITFGVFKSIPCLEKQKLANLLSNYLSAAAFANQACSILELAKIIKCPIGGDDPLSQFYQVFSRSESSVGDVIACFNSAAARYPSALQVVDRFPESLVKLFREGDGESSYLGLLRRFTNATAMNQTVARLINEVEPRSQELLHALQELRDALQFHEGGLDCFDALCYSRVPDLHTLCSYLAYVSWCISTIHVLLGGYGTLIHVIESGGSTASVRSLVQELMICGTFTICLPGAKKYATLALPDGSLREVSDIELGDIPYQLCLLGNTMYGGDCVDLANEETMQQRFLQFMSLVTKIGVVLLDLSTAGHPNYQEVKLHLDGSLGIEKLEDILSEESRCLDEWQRFLTSADVDLPLLTCLSRKQLVKGMQLIVTANKCFELSEVIRSVFPNINQSEGMCIVSRFLSTLPESVRWTTAKLSIKLNELMIIAAEHFAPSIIQHTDDMSLVIAEYSGQMTSKISKGVCIVKVINKDSHVEICCSNYISMFGRLPAGFEVFSCSYDSSELDVIDFIRRWAASTQFRKYVANTPMMFTMLNIELLKPCVQGSVLAKLHILRRSACFGLVMLASVENEQESLLCSALRSDRVTIVQSLAACCLPICKKAFAEFLPQVKLYSSAFPSSGKTTAILQEFATSAETQYKKPYACIPVTGDLHEAVCLLNAVQRDRRRLACENGIILHMNIANTLDIEKLNRFLLSYIITGVVMDLSGEYSVKHDEDVIILEWPSEGAISDSACQRSVLYSAFACKNPVQSLCIDKYVYKSCLDDSDSVLYYIVKVDDLAFKLGLQMAIQYFRAIDGDKKLAHHASVADTALPEPEQLYEIFKVKLTCPRSPPPAPGNIYRYVRFLAHQLRGLYSFPHYAACTEDAEEADTVEGVLPHCHITNFRKLAFHMARCSDELAEQLASAAVQLMTQEFVEDDTRLQNLTLGFHSWRLIPFLIFNCKDGECGDGNINTSPYPEMVSVTGDSFWDVITAGNSDAVFKAFIDNVANYNGNGSRQSILSICSQLTDMNYNPETDQSEDHALRRLVPLLSEEENFGVLIFEALKALHAPEPHPNISITQPISNLEERFASALDQLKRIIGPHKFNDLSTIRDFVAQARNWLKNMTGSYSDNSAAPFVLTPDSLIRLLAIKLRLVCKIPVVFMGETGCGKTHTVDFYCRVSGCLPAVINVHGGMQPEDLLNELNVIIEKANGSRVVILLDEVNSMPCVWSIKELVCDNIILGRRVPENVRFICVMNPRQRRKMVQNSSGLDFSPYYSGESERKTSLSPLVFEVNRAPESLMNLVWDFGSPIENAISRDDANKLSHERQSFPRNWNTISEESLFTENLIHWMIEAKLPEFFNDNSMREETGLLRDLSKCEKAEGNGQRHFRYMRNLLCAIIEGSQRFLREEAFGEISAASYRDIARTVSLIPFLVRVQQKCGQLDPVSAHGFLYFKYLNVALQVSITLNYALQLQGNLRQGYFNRIREIWGFVHREHSDSVSKFFLPVVQHGTDIYSAFDRFATTLCGFLALEDGIAINEALKENICSLFCSIMGDFDTGVTQFIVGRPGTSKSSSLDVLCASSDPNSSDPRTRFFKLGRWKEIRKFVLQCTPDTVAADILRVARRAANFQKVNPNCICVIVLEEIGVTVGSAHNPLMVLHGLMDRGVELDGTYIRLPVIGISNWRLDSSKMNRMRVTYRGNPSVADLVNTAECIMRSKVFCHAAFEMSFEVKRSLKKGIQNFAQTFSDFVLSENKRDKDVQDICWFYGMRDFYAFVQMLQVHISMPLDRELGIHGGAVGGNIDAHLIRWATTVSFGGHPVRRLELSFAAAINDSFFQNADQQVQPARWVRIGSPQVQMCDMCARVDHYTDVRTKGVDDLQERRSLFITHFQKCIGGTCGALDTALPFRITKLLSYYLNGQIATMENIYRIRHVLLFTRANAALHLLLELKIVQKEHIEIIFGRSDPSASDILDDLLRVRRCMLSGKVLILVAAKHLYESLYDPLNQHYTVEGEGDMRRYYTRLTMNGFTTSFPMHISFKCIVIEQETTSRALLPPFINRFAKGHLNYASVLTIPQLNLARAIRNALSIPAKNGQKAVDILPLLIPGYSEGTIDSLAFTFLSEDLDTTLFQDAVENAMARLYYLCSPRRLMHLSSGALQAVSGDRPREVMEWNESSSSRHHSVIKDVCELQKFYNVRSVHHLFILTEQRRVDITALSMILKKTLSNLAALHLNTIDLDKIVADGEINSHLEMMEKSSSTAFIIAVFDTLYNDCSDRVERFMYLVNSKQLPDDKHVILVGVVQSSAVPANPADKFHLHFDPGWIYVFIDELSADDESIDSLNRFLNQDASFSGVLSPELFCQFAASKALSIAQHIESDPRCIETLHHQLISVFSKDQNLSITIAERILENVDDLEDIRDSRWQYIAITKFQYVDSLRQQLILYLSSFVERSILQYATFLFAFGNFGFCEAQSPLKELFSLFFQSHSVVPQQDLTGCTMVDLQMSAVWRKTGASDIMFVDRSVQIRFPFSFLLYHVLQPISISLGEDAMYLKLAGILGNRAFSPEEVEAYACDILGQKGVLSRDAQCVALKIIAAKQVTLLSIAHVHSLMESNSELFDAVVRFVIHPCVQIEVLQSIDRENLSAAILAAACEVGNILHLDLVPDVIILAGDSFSLRLQHAISLGVYQTSLETKLEAGKLFERCRDGYEQVLNELCTNNPIAVELSKFILPVIFRPDIIPANHIQDVLLKTLSFVFQHFAKLGRPAVAFVINHCINFMMIADINCANLLAIFDQALEDQAKAVLISRGVFDWCNTSARVASALKKVDTIPSKQLLQVLKSGVITSALEMMCVNVQHENQEGGSTVVYPSQLNQLKGLLDCELAKSSELAWSATIFVLRFLSSGGIEIENAKRVLSTMPSCLPNLIFHHHMTTEICRPEDSCAVPFNIIPDYVAAASILRRSIHSRNIELEMTVRFESLHVAGKIASLLVFGYVQDSKEIGSGNAVLLETFLPLLNNPLCEKFVLALLDQEQLPQAILGLPLESKKLWVCTLITILTSSASICQYLSDIVAHSAAQHGAARFGNLSIRNCVSTQACRYLYSAVELASGIIHNQPPAAMDAADEVLVGVHKSFIFDEILNSRCPGCRNVMNFWPGCFSVECEHCHTYFCGWCFAVCNDSDHCHQHVLQCVDNPNLNSYFGNENQYNEVRRSKKMAALQEYFEGIPQRIRRAVLDSSLTEITDLGISVDGLAAMQEYSIPLCLIRMQSAVSAIKQVLFAGAATEEPASLWLSGLLLHHITASVAECSDAQTFIHAVQGIYSGLGAPSAVVDTLRHAGEGSGLKGLIAWSWDGVGTAPDPHPLDQSFLPLHYVGRQRMTLDRFWDTIARNNQYRGLTFLHENSLSLSRDLTEPLVYILNYVGDVVRACQSLQITKRIAAEMRLGTLAEQFPDLGGERLVFFCARLKAAYEQVERYECKDKAALDAAFGNITFDEHIPLHTILPSTSGEVTLIPVVYAGRSEGWRALGLIQNETVAVLSAAYGSPHRDLSRQVYRLTARDVVAFDENADVLAWLPLYVDPLPVPRLTDDLPGLQWQVVHGPGLWGKGVLGENLPEFRYSEDLRASVFGELADMFGEAPPLGDDAHRRLTTAMARDPSLAPDVMAFLTLAAVELVRRPASAIPHSLAALTGLVAFPLTAEQLRGRELLGKLLEILGPLRPEHVLAMCATLWDGGVGRQACVPLDPAAAGELTQDLEALRDDPSRGGRALGPRLLMGLRLVGLRFLSVPQSAAYLSAPLDTFLQITMGDAYDEDAVGASALARIPAAQFASSLCIADAVLGPRAAKIVSVLGVSAAGGGSFEVPVTLLELSGATRIAEASTQSSELAVVQSESQTVNGVGIGAAEKNSVVETAAVAVVATPSSAGGFGGPSTQHSESGQGKHDGERIAQGPAHFLAAGYRWEGRDVIPFLD